SDQSVLDEDIHWTEVVLEPGDTLKSIADEFGISEEDLRQANGLRKNEKPNPAEVLYVPDSHNDVTATLLFVRKLQKEELAIAKKGKLLETSVYIVKEGDTLWVISDKFNLEVDTLVGSNQKVLGGNINRLKLGMTLRIPNQDGIFVKVAKRDTLTKLTDKYGSTKESVLLANAMKSESLIAGSEIFLPGGKLVAVTELRIATNKNGRVRTATVKISSGSVRGFRWPVLGQISSPFGWRKSPFGRRRVFHSGLDIRAPRGTEIKAGASGVVVHSGWMGGYGKAVVISHSKGLTTLYGHCSKLIARKGMRVSQGQTIALVGSTGRSTGNHVHFEVRVNGTPQNPLRHLR
ncbi:MAG: LysM peptidoglycan-binding domain-containing M23 family metallopeptidase, partial [Cloacibacillus porcorum]|nr:LysM peptidoglycan-binding domain-containing M23 family metallopeptidase [Cloacibacillus porcorum]